MQNITSGKSLAPSAPLISFIIPEYNLPFSLLTECLDSLLSLDLDASQREIILVDDGSDDSILPLLDGYLDQIIYIRQPNGGLSAARNRAIPLCTGRYIQFVDGDDMLIPQVYNELIDILEKQPDTDMLLFHHTSKATKHSAPVVAEAPVSGTAFMRHKNLRASAWGYIFRRSILGNLRFTPDLLHEDEEFTPLLMIRAERVIETDATAYFYRQRKGSIVNDDDDSHKQKRLDDMMRIILSLNASAAHGPIEERTALRRRIDQLTMDYIYNIIILTRSEQQLSERTEQLSREGLFPLPVANYTSKYKWFSRLSASPAGLRLLLRSLPLLRRFTD